MTLEGELAAFATQTRWDDLPAGARERGRQLLLDAIACAFTGRTAPTRDEFAGAARALGDGAGHPVVGDATGAGRAASALINAWQTTATTMCDVYRPAMCHVTPPLLGAALAASGAAHSAGDLLRAFAIGAELTVRLCDGMDRSLYQGARWHAPGVIGPIGAATAAGLLAGFDAETLERAWGLAALQSGGTFAAIGSPGVKFTQARAALAGLLAADMTDAGLGGQLGGLTHPDGGLYVAYGGGDPRAAVRDLGARWSIHDIGMRRWPAASSLQAVIEAVLELRGEGGEPAAIDLALPTQSYRLCADKGWPDQLTALQSARWVAAVVWQDGRCWLDQFSAARLQDAGTVALAGRVNVTEDPALPQGSARVSAAGRTTEVLEALGSPARPLDTEDILGKLRLAAGAERAERVVSALDEDDIDGLRAALTASG